MVWTGFVRLIFFSSAAYLLFVLSLTLFFKFLYITFHKSSARNFICRLNMGWYSFSFMRITIGSWRLIGFIYRFHIWKAIYLYFTYSFLFRKYIVSFPRIRRKIVERVIICSRSLRLCWCPLKYHKAN